MKHLTIKIWVLSIALIILAMILLLLPIPALDTIIQLITNNIKSTLAIPLVKILLPLTITTFALAMIIIISIINQRYIKPLDFLTQEMHKLLDGKHYKRLKNFTKRKDEIGIINNFFNRVTLSLERISSNIRKGHELESDLSIAANIQKNLMPTHTLSVNGLEVAARTKSATEVGGDSFNYLHKDGEVFVYIGDVTGHGIPAALVMAMVDTLIHVYVEIHERSHQILTEVNRHLFQRIAANMFMSLVMLHWVEDERKLYYAGAGHEKIIIYRSTSRRVELLASGGIALGMIPKTDQIIKEKEIDLQDNDFLVLYTDGITEARNKQGKMYRVERLTEAIEKFCTPNASPDNVFDAITNDFYNYVGHDYKQADDITMIVVKKKNLAEDRDGSNNLKLTNDEDATKRVNSVWNS